MPDTPRSPTAEPEHPVAERGLRRERREVGGRSEGEGPEQPLASMVIMGADAEPCAVFNHLPGPEQEPQRATVVHRGDEWLVLDGTEPAPRCTAFKTAVIVALEDFRQRLNNIL